MAQVKLARRLARSNIAQSIARWNIAQSAYLWYFQCLLSQLVPMFSFSPKYFPNYFQSHFQLLSKLLPNYSKNAFKGPERYSSGELASKTFRERLFRKPIETKTYLLDSQKGDCPTICVSFSGLCCSCKQITAMSCCEGLLQWIAARLNASKDRMVQ